MRVMNDVIEDHGLDDQLEERPADETGNSNFWLGICSEMDEDSDQADPQAIAEANANALSAENEEKQTFIEAVQGALECQTMANEMERARMQLEDLRARVAAAL